MDEATMGPPKMPRWVKISLIVGLVVLVLVGLVIAFGPGEHGPGRHMSGGSSTHTGTGNHTAPTTHHGEQAALAESPALALAWPHL